MGPECHEVAECAAVRHDRRVLGRYRATGADPPFADPRRSHGVAMEGYFWRLTDARAGRAIIALCGVNRDRLGRTWAIAGLASHPGGFVRHAVVPVAEAAPRGLGVRAGEAFDGGPSHLHVDLGADARLSVRLDDVPGWGRKAYGGLGLGHAIPGLGQYWHPHGLGGRATGWAVLGGERVALEGATVYAEKNWSATGFPTDWWWGHASAFPDADACVAFAGGDVRVGPAGLTATAIVVRLEQRLIRLGNPLTSPVRAEIADGSWRLRGRGTRCSVELEGWAPMSDAHVLAVPLPAERRSVPGSLQHLDGRVRVTLRRGGRLLFTGESGLAGLEHGGRERAAAELERRAALDLAA
jgi:hypothetical protein